MLAFGGAGTTGHRKLFFGRWAAAGSTPRLSAPAAAPYWLRRRWHTMDGEGHSAAQHSTAQHSTAQHSAVCAVCAVSAAVSSASAAIAAPVLAPCTAALPLCRMPRCRACCACFASLRLSAELLLGSSHAYAPSRPPPPHPLTPRHTKRYLSTRPCRPEPSARRCECDRLPVLQVPGAVYL